MITVLTVYNMFVVDDNPSAVSKDEDEPDEDIASSLATLLGPDLSQLADHSLAQESKEGKVATHTNRN